MPRPPPSWLVLVPVLVIPAAITGWVLYGLYAHYQRVDAGTPTRAAVTRCGPVPGGHDIECTGSWTTGSGTVHGASASDVGRELDVHIVGHDAYAASQLTFLRGELVVFTVAPLVAWTLVARRIRRERRGRTR